jgi:DNA-binding PadR family transcriptional regulator
MEQALLGFLMEGPVHGYELHGRVEEELGRIWTMGISNIYGALKRLEEAGQVEFTLDPQESRPPRKVYHITPTGRSSFLDWVQRPMPSMRDMRVAFPAKLYLFHTLGLEGVDELIAAQEAVCRQRIERLERRADQCGPHAFDRLVFDFRRRQIEAILAWLKHCREEWQPWAHAPGQAGP